jgi:hypothetical protein
VNQTRRKNEAELAADGLRRSAQRMIALLTHPDPTVRVRAGSDVRHLGGFGVTQMVEALRRSEDPALRVALAQMLGETGLTDADFVRTVLLKVAAVTDEGDTAFQAAVDEAVDRLGGPLKYRPCR